MRLFGFSFQRKEDTPPWPVDANGERVAAAFLRHEGNSVTDTALCVNLLGAYGIPTLTRTPGEGMVGEVILGRSGTGVDIYVPETMLADAVDLLAAEPESEEEL